MNEEDIILMADASGLSFYGMGKDREKFIYYLEAFATLVVAAELRRLHHNNLVLTNALWKACGDDREVVNATIESQGELK